MSRRKKPEEPLVFFFSETLVDYFTEEGAKRNSGSKDYTRSLYLQVTDGDRFSRTATMDDVAAAIAALPAAAHLELEAKSRNKLRDAKAAKAQRVNSRAPEDIREACKTIPRWSDKDLREFADRFRNSENMAVDMCATLCDEILRMRRDLSAAEAKQ